MNSLEIKNIPKVKLVNDDFQVDFDIEIFEKSVEKKSKIKSFEEKEIEKSIADVNEKLIINNDKINELNKEIERLTNHADGLDYIIAASSGVIAGLIDIFMVGEWNFEEAKAISNEEINRKIQSFAKQQGYNGKRLEGAVRFLENKFPLPGDNTWSGRNLGVSAKSHHLDDFNHHPTFIGLFYSIMSQFTRSATYFNSESVCNKVSLTVNEEGLLEGKTPVYKVGAGLINWIFNLAKNRKGHLLSDMAGSNHTPGKGMGIPGPIISIIKELSSLPGFRDPNFHKKLGNAYKNGIGANKGQLDLGIFNQLFNNANNKMDYRTENAIMIELKRQSLPVLINDIVVRSFYFIRRLIKELKETEDLALIEWEKVLPINNRTINRMLTIATGTFTLIDLGDAAIRGAVKSGGNLAEFTKEFILRVNFVGIGRFVIAVGVDVSMGIKRENKRNERIVLMSEQLHLMNAKIFYFQANMWKTAETTAKTIEELKIIMKETAVFAIETWGKNQRSIQNISKSIDGVKNKNPDLIHNIIETIKWS